MQFLPILLPQTSYFCRMLYPLASFWLTLEPLYLSIHIFISKLTILVWVVQLRTANGTSMDTYGSDSSTVRALSFWLDFSPGRCFYAYSGIWFSLPSPPLGWRCQCLSPRCCNPWTNSNNRELFVAYSALPNFWFLLEGKEFVLFTDHKPLTHALFRTSLTWSAMQSCRCPVPSCFSQLRSYPWVKSILNFSESS